MLHVLGTMWRIKNQPSNSNSCSNNALRLLILVAGRLYWRLQVASSFSIWGCVLKGCFERGIIWRADSCSIEGHWRLQSWTLMDMQEGWRSVGGYCWSVQLKFQLDAWHAKWRWGGQAPRTEVTGLLHHGFPAFSDCSDCVFLFGGDTWSSSLMNLWCDMTVKEMHIWWTITFLST